MLWAGTKRGYTQKFAIFNFNNNENQDLAAKIIKQ